MSPVVVTAKDLVVFNFRPEFSYAGSGVLFFEFDVDLSGCIDAPERLPSGGAREFFGLDGSRSIHDFVSRWAY